MKKRVKALVAISCRVRSAAAADGIENAEEDACHGLDLTKAGSGQANDGGLTQ